MKRLSEFIDCPYDVMIHNIKSDSRNVKSGDLFVAVKGYHIDHTAYISDAISRGAVAVVTESDMEASVPVIRVSDVNQAYLDICAKFYNQREWNMDLIGVTGTDGKTTTATIIQELLDHFRSCCYIGTNGIYFKEEHYVSSNTTPLTETLYSYLDFFHREKCQMVSLEVSSEALLHNRVDDLKFRYAILTNISEDHLDFHKTIENYVAAKAKLFSLLRKDGYAILNIDDGHYEEICRFVDNKIITYGMSDKALFQIRNVKFQPKLMTFEIVYNGETFSISSPIIGIYNAYNLCAAFIICYLEKCDLKQVVGSIKILPAISGRGEFLDFGQNYSIVLDYAHTTNGIKNILETLQQMEHQRIITVVGSAGGREREKRASMGKVALEKSDFVIFTMDDPREERVSDIIDDLVSSTNDVHYARVEDRKDAIYKALSMAKDGDIVAILGKGRDSYMAVGDKKVPYCDYSVIDGYFNKKM